MALLFTDKDVGRLLTMEDAITAVEDVFRQWAQGEASLVPRMVATPPDTPGHYYLRWFMPGAIYGSGVIGAKILIVQTPGTEPRKRGTYSVLLFDSQDASLLAAIEGTTLTKIRTGAVTGAAAKYLARPSSATLGIFGTGAYAPAQVVAICTVLPIQRVKVYSRNPTNRQRFAQELRSLVKCDVTPVDSSQEVVVGSDVVVTVTNSSTPVFDGELLEAGTFISAAGSSNPNNRETDDRTILRSKIVVEYMEQALKEAGDLVIPIGNGVITAQDVYAELAEVIGGKKPGRVSDDEITLFKFNGIAIEDIACALRVYQRAWEQGVGAEPSAP